MYDNWEDLEQSIKDCKKCKLCTNRTNIVFGVGNKNADVMFIGEGPGADEDRLGEPFVGKAGKLMDKAFQALEIHRDKVYIANIVKCRPPKNRDPKPEEQVACTDWLRNQYKLINPKIIVCLGRIASAKIIKPDIKITKEHGLFFKKGDVLMMPMLHPAAVLRDPRKRPEAFRDFQILREKIKEICTDTYKNVDEE